MVSRSSSLPTCSPTCILSESISITSTLFSRNHHLTRQQDVELAAELPVYVLRHDWREGGRQNSSGLRPSSLAHIGTPGRLPIGARVTVGGVWVIVFGVHQPDRLGVAEIMAGAIGANLVDDIHRKGFVVHLQ